LVFPETQLSFPPRFICFPKREGESFLLEPKTSPNTRTPESVFSPRCRRMPFPPGFFVFWGGFFFFGSGRKVWVFFWVFCTFPSTAAGGPRVFFLGRAVCLFFPKDAPPLSSADDAGFTNRRLGRRSTKALSLPPDTILFAATTPLTAGPCVSGKTFSASPMS